MENIMDVVEEVPYGTDVEAVEINGEMNDMDADSCIEKISNIERYRKFWLDYYAKKVNEVNEKCDRNVAYQQRKLRYFFATVPHRSTKTMEAYDLPHGRISVTFPERRLVPNKDAILKRFIKSGDREFVKVVESLDWSGYKARLFISDDGDVLDRETGEIIKDVDVEITEPTFSVKPSKDKGDESNE